MCFKTTLMLREPDICCLYQQMSVMATHDSAHVPTYVGGTFCQHMSLHMLPKPRYLTTYVPTYVVRYQGFGNICRDICWQNVPPNICRDMCRVMCCHNRHVLVLATYVWFPQHKSSFKTHVGTCASQNSYACLGYI